MCGAHRLQLAVLDVADRHGRGILGRAVMLDLDDGRVETQAHRIALDIELVVDRRGGCQALHAGARQRRRNHGAHQGAGHAGIAVREVENVGIRIGEGEAAAGAHGLVRHVAEVHARETGIPVAPGIGGRRAIDPDPEIAFGRGLEVRDELRIVSADVGQELLVGRLGQDLQLLLARLARQVVARRVQQLDEVALGLVVERGQRHPVGGGVAGLHQLVGAEHLLAEEHRAAQLALFGPFAVVEGLELLGIDADVAQQRLHRRREIARRLQGLRPAVADQLCAIAGGELVAAGVAAEVIVVLEDQDLRLVARLLAIEKRRGQAADAATDDDQIIGLAGIFRSARRIPRMCRRAPHA